MSKVFTATPESFGIPSKKVIYMGQAVDVDRFFSLDLDHVNKKEEFKVITVGRITPIKNLDTLILAVDSISKQIPIMIDIIGSTATKDDLTYHETLKELIKTKGLQDRVRFVGSVANKDLPKVFATAQLSINLCPTGGLDKTVLESMASGIPVLVSNTAFREHMGIYAKDLMFAERDHDALAELLGRLYVRKDLSEIGRFLQKQVRIKSSINTLIKNIVDNIV